ncbi:hypothetical protein [uncultured Sphingomonas sp.]|uniref:spike base protein, RCAP_Rcc01079 family n=1 Tax=uncultured Sphingomonas sp. TaxID=158754 RepID=UPI0035CB5F08
MPIDSFEFSADHPAGPSRAPFAVAPHDVDPLPILPKALYVGTAGDVTLRGVAASADVVFRNCAAGQILDVRASHVRATGTTAADIVALG